MKFRVIGAHRDTGARMALEFEAESKAAAERKAALQGMSVNRVEDVSEGYAGHAYERIDASARRSSGIHPLLKLLLVIILLAFIAYIFRGPIRAHLPR